MTLNLKRVLNCVQQFFLIYKGQVKAQSINTIGGNNMTTTTVRIIDSTAWDREVTARRREVVAAEHARRKQRGTYTTRIPANALVVHSIGGKHV